MDEMTPDMEATPDTVAPQEDGVSSDASKLPERDKRRVAEIIKIIKDDKRHHEKAFKRMRRDMQIAMWGADKDWGEENYRANISGRHVKMKTASLYAKNPKVVAKRRQTLDFQLWDENPATAQLALQQLQMAQQMMAAVPPSIDPVTMQPAVPPPPPGMMEAQALLQDIQTGLQRRAEIAKFGKTLEILFDYFLREQIPVSFKKGMKQVVRRAGTTGVGYVELGFQREYGPRPGMTEKLADARTRLDHLRNLAEQVAEGEVHEYDSEMAELEHSMLQLQNEPEIVLREGLILDYPVSTKVIPDKATKQLDGFVGAGHLTLEYTYTVAEVREIFNVDLGDQYTSYSLASGTKREFETNNVFDEDYEWSSPEKKKNGYVCVWKFYDKATGLVYYLADGYHGYLREPAAPDVFVERFWPVYALTFNAVESEDELFPPSDVALLFPMQKEYNRARQGLREHRHAARPRWVYPKGAFGDEEDPMMLKDMKPFEALGLNIDPAAKVQDIFQAFPVPGVDPNLYETNQLFTDIQLVGGAQEAQYGATSNATATEAALASSSTSATDSSSVEDLDAFLSDIARDAGQILMREMSEEKVLEIVGPGAVWPQMTLSEIMKEVALEIEAGSTGKPNQANEIRNWQQMLPFLVQMPNIDPMWLARETVRRLDDKADLTEAVAAGIPSIMAQNQQMQPAVGPNDPNQQGGEGANNAEKPQEMAGSDPAMGSNRAVGAPQQQSDGNVVAA